MSSEAALLEEISRLSGAINRRNPQPQAPASSTYSRKPPPYKAHYPARKTFTDYTPVSRPGATANRTTTPKQEVVIDGVKFESNGKTLVRKPAQAGSSTEPTATRTTAGPSAPPQPPKASAPSVMAPHLSTQAGKPLVRTRNGLIAADRYKKPIAKPLPKPGVHPRYPPVVTGYRTRATPGRNLTLNKKPRRKPKKYEKQCKHFVKTGMCGRGMTCKYQHDPQQIALCPLFLAEKCPYKDNPSECALSHEPTPERTPICTRFNSTGECYKGSDCLYPHIRVGAKVGVCRDFAVLGYCAKGAMCEASHLKECPDFAETGVCKKMGLKGAAGCKLPHVIRANQRRIGIAKAPRPGDTLAPVSPPLPHPNIPSSAAGKRKATEAAVQSDLKKVKLSPEVTTSSLPSVTVGPSANGEDAEEFISLTILESEDEDGDDDEDDDEDDEDDEADGEEFQDEAEIPDTSNTMDEADDFTVFS